MTVRVTHLGWPWWSYTRETDDLQALETALRRWTGRGISVKPIADENSHTRPDAPSKLCRDVHADAAVDGG
jgi:hypothetical protein